MHSEYPSFSELVQFRNQYTIAKNLNLPGIIQTYSLEPYHNGYALIVGDFGGIFLKEWTGKGKTVKSLAEFFQIAIALGNTLDILCRHRIIHKDIKPANILINPDTKEVKLIDFNIASLLPWETQTLISPRTQALKTKVQDPRFNAASNTVDKKAWYNIIVVFVYSAQRVRCESMTF